MYPCDFCWKCYPLSKLLHRHVESDHHKVMPICDLCCKSFPDFKSLEKHKRTHFARFDVPCPVCGFVLPADTLDRHVIQYHPVVTDWVCDSCGQAFREVGDFREHIEGCSDERGTDESRRVQCFSCGETFARDREFLRHMDADCQVRDRVGKCGDCAVPFYAYSDMLNHAGNCRVRTLDKIITKRYECELCPMTTCRTFHKRKYLKKHIENVHAVEEPEIPCFECDQNFSSFSKLLLHVENCHDVGSESDLE